MLLSQLKPSAPQHLSKVFLQESPPCVLFLLSPFFHSIPHIAAQIRSCSPLLKTSKVLSFFLYLSFSPIFSLPLSFFPSLVSCHFTCLLSNLHFSFSPPPMFPFPFLCAFLLLLLSLPSFSILSIHLFLYTFSSPVYNLGFTIPLNREGNGTQLQYSWLANPMDGGAW